MDLTTLEAPERTLLARLSPFRDGCTLDAIDEVLRTSWDHLADPFDVLQDLVSRGWVQVEEPPRYRLPESLRERVAESMSPSEKASAMAGLFAWADGFCARVAQAIGVDQERALDRAERDLENLEDAIAYGSDRRDLRSQALRMAVDLRHFWAIRGHFKLGRTLVEPTLDAGDEIPDALRAQATNLVGVLALGMGDLPAAERRLSESLALARRMDDAVSQGGALVNLGMIAWERMDYAVARDDFQEAAAILQTYDEKAKLGIALLNLGCVLIDMDRFDEARSVLEKSLEPLDVGGNLGGRAFAEGNLGYLALVRSHREDALRHVRASLDAFSHFGDWKGTMNTLISASMLLAPGDPDSAATIRGAIDVMSAKSAPTPRDELRLVELDGTLGAESLVASRRKGNSMSPREAIEYALAALQAMVPGTSSKSRKPEKGKMPLL